jgi:DNA-binding GntR family transcriptional regulator
VILRSGSSAAKWQPTALFAISRSRLVSVSAGALLREALARLVLEGLFRSEPDRGSCVETVSRRQVEEIYWLRSTIELFCFAVLSIEADSMQRG